MENDKMKNNKINVDGTEDHENSQDQDVNAKNMYEVSKNDTLLGNEINLDIFEDTNKLDTNNFDNVSINTNDDISVIAESNQDAKNTDITNNSNGQNFMFEKENNENTRKDEITYKINDANNKKQKVSEVGFSLTKIKKILEQDTSNNKNNSIERLQNINIALMGFFDMFLQKCFEKMRSKGRKTLCIDELKEVVDENVQFEFLSVLFNNNS